MTTNNAPPARMQEWADRCSAKLGDLLPAAGQSELAEAMRYSALSGGKRLRASLVYEGGIMLEASPDQLDQAASAVEMIHAYSLIHDDLPAMDNDALRRGKPTCHKVYGEAMAILAGDALQTRAFQVLSQPVQGIPADVQLQMVLELARASGDAGMAGGQAVDLRATGQTLDLEQLKHMHGMKTGALIRASLLIGVLASDNADPQTYRQLSRFADALGLVFQVVDDILDETMDSAVLGKHGGSDRAQNKPTYTSVLGVENARQIATHLHQDALASLNAIRHNTQYLEQLANFVIARHY